MRLFGSVQWLVLVLSTASCATTASKRLDAASVFSHSQSCPIEEVLVTEQESPPLREAVLAESPPPPDVASEPDRLAMWVESHEQRNGRMEGTRIREYSAAGCTSAADIVCADGWFGLTRCSVNTRRNSWK